MRAPAVARVARKELVEWRRDRWLIAATLLMALLGMTAAISGTVTARSRARITSAAQQRDYQRWLDQPERNAHSASHFGVSAYYVPSRLAPLDPGVVPYAGASLFLEAHKQNEPTFAEAPDGGAVARLGGLSLATLLQVWLPLLVIVVGAGAFAAEREHGTLALLLSVGASPWSLLTGKALAIAVVVAAVAAPGVVIAGASLPWLPGPWPADLPRRVLVLAAAHGCHLAFWIAITLAVSARLSSWRLAIACLVTVWCLCVVVLPRVAIDLARAAHPLPSRAELDRLELESRISPPGGYERRRKEILAEYGVSRVEDLPIEFSVIYAQRAEARINQRIDQRMHDLDAVYGAERADYRRAAFITPSVAVDLLSMAAAGTDEQHHRAFLRQAELYRRRMMAILSAADVRRPGEKARRGDAALWRQLPPFRYEVPALDGVWSVLATLATWCAAGLILSVLAIRSVVPR